MQVYKWERIDSFLLHFRKFINSKFCLISGQPIPSSSKWHMTELEFNIIDEEELCCTFDNCSVTNSQGRVIKCIINCIETMFYIFLCMEIFEKKMDVYLNVYKFCKCKIWHN